MKKAKGSEIPNIQSELANIKSELTNIKPELTSIKPELTNIKSELTNIKSELTNIKPELTNIKPELTNIKPELKVIKSELTTIKPDIIQPVSLIRSDTEPINFEETSNEVNEPIEHGLPSIIIGNKRKPKHPKKINLNLEKIASINTDDLFSFDKQAKLNFSDNEIITYDNDLNAVEKNDTIIISKKRSKNILEIGQLRSKYNSNQEEINFPELSFTGEVNLSIDSIANNSASIVLSPDGNLDHLIGHSENIGMSSRKIKEQMELEEFTKKFDFELAQNDKNDSSFHNPNLILGTEDNIEPIDEQITVRIKCNRKIFAYPVTFSTKFETIFKKLAEDCSVNPSQILVTLRDDTVLSSETPGMLNLEPTSFLDALILQKGVTQDGPIIKLRIQFPKKIGGRLTMKAPSNATFRKILEQICEKKNINSDKMHFQFDGDDIELDKQLIDYDLENNDVIDAIIN